MSPTTKLTCEFLKHRLVEYYKLPKFLVLKKDEYIRIERDEKTGKIIEVTAERKDYSIEQENS